MRKNGIICTCLVIALNVMLFSGMLVEEGLSPRQEYVVFWDNQRNSDASQLDEKFAIAELTLAQAKKMREKNNVLLEENIVFSGSELSKTSNKFDDELSMYLEYSSNMEKSIEPERQWNIDAIHANHGEYSKSYDRVKVAIMDSGIMATSDIEVSGRVNFVDGEDDLEPLFEDISGHGTSVASIIAAKDNGIGVTGINPNAEIYSVRVLNSEQKASLGAIVKGLYWCIENDIDIINMSFGSEIHSEILEKVICEVDKAGILMIASAGNCDKANSDRGIEFPACYEPVIAVGATNKAGQISDFTPNAEKLNLVAPGENIPATGFFDEIVFTNGTSMAAPHVTGVASVLWSKNRQKSADFIKQLLITSGMKLEQKDVKMVDLDYAMSIYDNFEKNYVKDSFKKEADMLENHRKVKSYEEDVYHANWLYSEHKEALGQCDQVTSSVLELIKKGAEITDTASFLKAAGNNGDRDSFHGSYNFVANYIYVMRIARLCYDNGMAYALANASYPTSGTVAKNQILGGLTQLNSNWSSYLSGSQNTKQNQARVLVGIATHIAMDAYAHRAYANVNGNWSYIRDLPNDRRDDTTYLPGRWNTAKAVGYDIVTVWHYNYIPDAEEYYQPGSHNKDEFHLDKFDDYVTAADTYTANSHPQWFLNRTSYLP